MGLTTELTAHADAPWAPPIEGARWAFRIVNGDGEVLLTGTSNRRKAEVTRMLADMTRRLEDAERGRASINWRALNRVGFGRGDYA